MRILSGIQPSGKLHLGNYFAMMKPMIEYQKEADLFCFIASLHSLTTMIDPKELEANIMETAASFLALGLNPNKSIFWVQSDVQEVSFLAWILSRQISTMKLQLSHSYKDKTAHGVSPSSALFFYPVLMTADILAFGADRVPVGKDQKQHMEICRLIANRFNQHYGEVFTIPKIEEILSSQGLIPGIDGYKMSKSRKNIIPIFDTEKNIKKSVMSIITDSKGVQEVKDPENSPLYQIYCLFLDKEGQQELADKFRTPGTGYGHIKAELYQRILDYFQPFHKKRMEFLQKPDEIRDILKHGASKASKEASPILENVRRKVGLVY